MNRKFTHDGKEFEIRCAQVGNSHRIAVFHNGKRLCEDEQVLIDAASDLSTYHGESEIVFRKLENEVRSGRIRA